MKNDLLYQEFENAYFACALWASLDENDNPLDTPPVPNFDADTLEQMKVDARAFWIENKDVIMRHRKRAKKIHELAAHDFWLTRNRHGAGFWDSPEIWGDDADHPTESAQGFGEYSLTTEDGVIYGI